MTQSEKLYSALGHMSVSFAEVEQNLRDLLILHISKGEHSLVGQYLVEGMPLVRLLELTKNVVLVHSPRQSDMLLLIASIEPLRKERNAFIHGNWKVPSRAASGSEPAAWYTSNRIKSSDVTLDGERAMGWSRSSTTKIPLSKIQSITEKLIDIIKSERILLKDLSTPP